MTPSQNRQNGFTLLEILIAIVITAIVLSTIYAAYSSTLTTIDELDRESRAFKMARVTLERITKDLASLQPHAGGFVLAGEDDAFSARRFDRVSFWSASHLSFDTDNGHGTPASITYFVRQDPGRESFSLWRSDQATAKPPDNRRPDGGVIICQDVDTFTLTYYDREGRSHEKWDTASFSPAHKDTPPAMIRIELALVNARDAEKPFRFATQVYIPVRKDP